MSWYASFYKDFWAYVYYKALLQACIHTVTFTQPNLYLINFVECTAYNWSIGFTNYVMLSAEPAVYSLMHAEYELATTSRHIEQELRRHTHVEAGQ